jgi:selenide, water dikinase
VNGRLPSRDLVLLGGGHSHVAVLRQFGMHPVPGVRVTLVSRHVDTPYSGMLPGLIAGHYTYEEAHIDLQRLARFAGARDIFDEAIGLDLANRQLHFRARPPVSYDLLSIDIGSTPRTNVPGALTHAVPVKPIDRFLERWNGLRERLASGEGPKRIAVVGGGAGGVELVLAIQYALGSCLESRESRGVRFEYLIFTAGDAILPTHNPRVRRVFARILDTRGVRVHTGSPVVEVMPGRVRMADGREHAADEILWVTDASAAAWLAGSGLAVDEGGFVRVSTALQSISHPEVFAAGDVASMVDHPRPKSGVFAVRQGRPLALNLRRTLLGQRLSRYRPQRRFLSLISTGDRYAVASRGHLALRGAWVWRWKDAIDRRFMRRYSELPDMAQRETAGEVPEAAAIDAQGAADAMRCGGCGAKVGAVTLARALQRVGVSAGRPDVLVGLDAPDDAAVLAVPPASECKALIQSIDFFRPMVEDPYVFGEIAANHALGDVYAMGGEPHAALALVTIPPGPEDKIEETLTHILAGALRILREAGAVLVGGHTGEGSELGAGFAVTGLVDRDRILRKSGLRPGDRLVLTKAIGTGALFAADMRHRAKGRWIAEATASMLQSNRDAAGCLIAHGAAACTDVTGFGLVGHVVEMLRASNVDAEIDLGAVPLLEGAADVVRAGLLSSLQPQNQRLAEIVTATPALRDDPRFALLFDPQTAGGLLAGVPAHRAEACVAALRERGYARSALVGTVTPRGPVDTRLTLKG